MSNPWMSWPWNSIKSHAQHLFHIKWKFASFTVLHFIYFVKDKASISIKIKDYTLQYCLWTAYSNVQYTYKRKMGIERPLAPATSNICKELWEMRGTESSTASTQAKFIEKNRKMWMAQQCVTCIQSSSENEYMDKWLYCKNQTR